MDFVSHVLIGRALATSPKNSGRNIFLITFFSFLPDLPQIILYVHLGLIKSRPFWVPLDMDWNGYRDFYPIWSAIWEIPHSILFAFLVILPLVLYFKLPKIAFIAYLSHIFIDLFTHTGEWSMKMFYPLPFKISGFTDAWAWPFANMFLSWFILFIIIAVFHFGLRYRYLIKKLTR